MGHIYYGSDQEPTRFPDRILTHLQVVITTKMRRGESFTLTRLHSAADQGGKTTIWMQPSIPLRFVFDSAEPEALNPATLQEMAHRASSSSGLVIDVDLEIPEIAAKPAPVPQAHARRSALKAA